MNCQKLEINKPLGLERLLEGCLHLSGGVGGYRLSLRIGTLELPNYGLGMREYYEILLYKQRMFY